RMPGTVRPLEAELALPVGIVCGQVHLVRGGDVALRWIARRGQLIPTPEARPLVPSVAGHGQQSGPITADRSGTADHPGYIALHIRIHIVEARRQRPGDTGSEGGIVLCECVRRAAEVSGGSRLQPSGTYGVGPARVGPDDRTMPREQEFGFGSCCAFDTD